MKDTAEHTIAGMDTRDILSTDLAAVAQVCKYTWYCDLGDIYANTTGYTFIGNLIVRALR